MATLVGKYIAQNLKSKGIDQLNKIKENYLKSYDENFKLLDLNNTERKNIINENLKTLNERKFTYEKIKDGLGFVKDSVIGTIWTNLIRLLSSLKDIFLGLLNSKGVLLQYILLIILFIVIIVAIYGGFNSSTTGSKSVLQNESNKNSPSDILNANNIYKEDNGFLSKLVPKSIYYYLTGLNNSFSKVFYNKDIILENSIDRPNDNDNGRCDEMITVPKYNNLNYIQTYLKPKNIEWKLSENSLNIDFNNLPDYIKDYKAIDIAFGNKKISLNDKKIIVFPFTSINGIYKLDVPYYKYDSEHTKTPINVITKNPNQPLNNNTIYHINQKLQLN